MPLSDEEINRRYTYHPPTDPRIRDLHDACREFERDIAQHINNLPGDDSRERSLAFTALEEMSFWIHAHVARNLHRAVQPAAPTD